MRLFKDYLSYRYIPTRNGPVQLNTMQKKCEILFVLVHYTTRSKQCSKSRSLTYLGNSDQSACLLDFLIMDLAKLHHLSSALAKL